MRTAEDAGLSSQRTSLSWQRTALSLVVASAAIGRISAPRTGWIAIVFSAAAALLALLMVAESRWRYTRRHSGPPYVCGRSGRAVGWLTSSLVHPVPDDCSIRLSRLLATLESEADVTLEFGATGSLFS